MGLSTTYVWTAVLLSASAVVLSTVYAVRVIKAYQRYHDERAAVSLAKAIGLWVIALGLVISSSGLVLNEAVMSVAGLSLSRGTFLVLMLTLVLADVRPRMHEEKEVKT
jgi:uncharacterized protein YebE (UPF0316 family)